jgi:hypothetical protein
VHCSFRYASDAGRDPAKDARSVPKLNVQRVSNFEKFLLVLFGYYPDKNSVPAELPRDRLARVWEKMRIGVNSTF